nr:unnamed protein product [Digitaria exilis]
MATCLVGGFQTAIVGVILRRDKKAWKIGWDINLLTIVYSSRRDNAGDCRNLRLPLGQSKRDT